jgi:MFS family permease
VPYPTVLRALNSRNYRLFFGGQGVSLLGNWMTVTASAWLVYELSRNPFLVGLLAFANQIPVLLLAPLGGIWGDRVDRQRLMWWLNLLSGVQATTLALIALTGNISVGWLLALSTVRGLINAFEFPTRQSFIVDLVERKADLSNAIALNSSMFNVARLIGPAIAGLLIATQGPEVCYTIDALSYVAILMALLAMRRLPRRRPTRQRHPWEDLREGFRYVRRSPTLRPPLLLVPMIALAGFTSSTLAPVFARDIFHGTSVTLGQMYSAVGVGALASALLLAGRRSADGLARWVTRGSSAVVVALLGFALSPTYAISLVCLALNGFGTVLAMAGSNTLIQAHVADDKRSRVMGLFAMGQGMFPVGALLAGTIAAVAGPRVAVGIAAGVVAIAVIQFSRRANLLTGPAKPSRPAPLPSDLTT